jgi:hypothetical protein
VKLTDIDDRRRTRLAAELDAMSVELERLGSELCASPLLASEHFLTLQSIDLLAQRQRALAELLRDPDWSLALDRCCLEDVRQALST